jgi:hypothetical protein
LKGQIKIVSTSIPSAFTAFIIDDEVFFFPFLATDYSTQTPTLLASIDTGLGKCVYNHFKKILSDDAVMRKMVKIIYPENQPT